MANNIEENQINSLKLEIAQLKGIQSAMPDPYYVRDMDYNIILWPDAIAKVTGYSAAEAKRRKCYEIFKAGVCPPAGQCPTQTCIQNRQFLHDVAVDVFHKSGSTIHSLVSNAGVYDDNGQPIAAVEVVKDNTLIQASMDTIGQTIKNVDVQSDELSKSLDQIETLTGSVNDMSAQAVQNVKTGVSAGQSVYSKTEQSNNFASGIQGNIKKINESMKLTVEKINSLKAKLETIIQFVKVIQEISAKTNLLAINASIEAAHAGESGRGFKVVADGIRELSKNSSESAQEINKTIMEINSLVRDTTGSLNTTEKDLGEGTKGIADLVGRVKEIDEDTKVLLNTLIKIENAEISSGNITSEQGTLILHANQVSGTLASISQKLAYEFERVFKAIQHQDMG
ncbi:MAG: methyl-accepting chemotaxis protein [Treponema sp.]|jgi:PAS domain S-box-containing protein|nr:methyl-accepting chemotaxis protein [Treponema sp.]